MGASTGDKMHELATLSSRWLRKNHGVFYQTGVFSWYLSAGTDAVALPVLGSHSQLVCDVPGEPPGRGGATCAEYIPQPLPSAWAGVGAGRQADQRPAFLAVRGRLSSPLPVLQSCNTAPPQPLHFLGDPLPSTALAALKIARSS